MKSLFAGIALCLFTSSVFAGASDLILNARSFVTVSHDEMISKITGSRANLLVASGGPLIRRDCFKEYRLNFPHTPQTVPYMIELNLPVKFAKNTLTFEKVIERSNELANKLRSRISTGCKTDISVMVLIEGESNNGLFRSEVQFFLTKEGIKVQSGTLSEKITPGVSKNINLVPSTLLGDLWDASWKNFNPSLVEARRNY
jgi:hypothetical protein